MTQAREFLRYSATMAGGAALAQALPVIVSPLLTRLYSPADFGVYAIFFACASVAAVIYGGRYEMAIPVPRSGESAYRIFLLSCLAATALAVISLALVALFLLLQAWNGGTSVRADMWLLAIPIGALGMATLRSAGYWLGRNKQYMLFSKLRVTQGVLIATLSITLGYVLDEQAGGLVIAAMVAYVLIGLISLGCAIRVNPSKFYVPAIVALARKYRRYPIYSLPTALVDAFTLQLPTLCFARVYEASVLGQYGLAFRVLAAPISVISASVAQVFMQQVAAAINHHPEQVLQQVRRVFTKLFLVGTVIFTPIMVFGAYAFEIVFGASWRDAGYYSQIMALSMWIKFIVSPLSGIFVVAQRHGTIAKWQISYFLATVAAVGIGLGVEGTLTIMLWIVAAVDVILYGVYALLVFKLARKITIRRSN